MIWIFSDVSIFGKIFHILDAGGGGWAIKFVAGLMPASSIWPPFEVVFSGFPNPGGPIHLYRSNIYYFGSLFQIHGDVKIEINNNINGLIRLCSFRLSGFYKTELEAWYLSSLQLGWSSKDCAKSIPLEPFLHHKMIPEINRKTQ